MFWKVKIRQSDKLFSIYIRKRDKWRCVRCGKQHDEHSHNFGVSHFYSRRKESVRFDPENVDSMCNHPCHSEWEHEKKEGREYYNFKINQLGKMRFDILTVRAHQIAKKDDKLMMLIIKEFIKRLEESA